LRGIGRLGGENPAPVNNLNLNLGTESDKVKVGEKEDVLCKLKFRVGKKTREGDSDRRSAKKGKKKGLRVKSK